MSGETLEQKCERLAGVVQGERERHRAELEALGVPLGPDGRPDCGFCAERQRLVVGLHEENRQLRARIAGRDVPISDEMVDAAVRALNDWPADMPISELHRLDERWKAMRRALDAVGRTP